MMHLIRDSIAFAITFILLTRTAYSIREGQPDDDDIKYMQRTIDYTLSIGKCLEQPFAASIVRKKTGEILCYGVNSVSQSPTWHGEIKAIENCAAIYPDQGNNATFWRELTLYATGEPCPMCSAAILWSRIGRLVISTPMSVFASTGFAHIPLKYNKLADQVDSNYFTDLEVVEGVLAEVTNPWFNWQYNAEGKCPSGCHKEGNKCKDISETITPRKDDSQSLAHIKSEL